MPKILFVALHRPNRSPSQRFRYEQYLDYLQENGFNYEFSYIINAKDDTYFYGAGNYFQKLQILLKSFVIRFNDILKSNQYDIIFVQREALMLGTAFFEKKYAQSKAKLVFDFDDSIWLQTVSNANKALGFLKNANKTKEIIAVSDMIFAGNRYLADYALQFNQNVKIIPTTVDTEKFKPELTIDKYSETKKVIEIGWTGSFSTIEHLRFGLPILYKIKEKYGDTVSFKVIGDSNFRDEKLNIKGIAWNSETEVADLQSIDIGIMPLPDDEWTQGKCGFKGLTYMSLAIPALMSPVGVNKEIIQNGENGFLPNTESEWIESLSRLIENANLRQKIGLAGRKTVIDKYSILSQRDNYVKFFKEVLGKS
jgi:glycosyltransferase involved in cell wall biosynthesis